MNSLFFHRTLTLGSFCLVLCCGCTQFKGSAPVPTSYGLLHRNVEMSELPQVRQVNHEQSVPDPAGEREEEREESSGQYLERQLDWLRGRGENHQASIRLLAEAEQIYNQATQARATDTTIRSMEATRSRYLQAAEIYNLAAHRWPDSALQEDAMFMAAESYFFGQRYPEADERYERVIKAYPKTRYLDQIQRRRFAIARYWLQVNQLDHQQFYEFNVSDESLPWRDQFNYALRILDQIRLDDPTGDIADDATLMAADACLEIGRFQQADSLFTDLIKTFPSSEHQYRAHWSGMLAKSRLYRGPHYGEEVLLEAEKLLAQLRRQFPQQTFQRQEQFARMQAEIHYKKAEREWVNGQFFDQRAAYGAARIYYQTLVSEYPDTPFAKPAQERLVATREKPAKPRQRFQWLADLFDDKDNVQELLKKPSAAEIQE